MPDLATNFFGNFNNNIRDEDEELSIGSIKDFNIEERIKYDNNNIDNNNNDNEKEYIPEKDINNNKMLVSSDSSNSSLDNIHKNCNINIYQNHKIKFNRCNINNPFCPANSQTNEFFTNIIDKKMNNKFNEIYPEINTFEYDYENDMKISASESIYFINKEGNENCFENKYEKKED